MVGATITFGDFDNEVIISGEKKNVQILF
jgi:hypothetical protein